MTGVPQATVRQARMNEVVPVATVTLMVGRYRRRTRIRRHLPWVLIELGMFPKGRRDCGSHEWYVEDEQTERCYHCRVGSRPRG